MKDATDADLLAEIRLRLATQQAELADLRAKLAAASMPVAEGKLADILRRALKSEKGWMDEARQALGDFTWIACVDCGSLFPSGGKRRFRCGQC